MLELSERPAAPEAPAINQEVARRFDETATLLETQDANPFRVRAYRQAAGTMRALHRPADEIVRLEGTAGLDRLPGIGPGLAAAIADFVASGRMPIQERLRARARPLAALRSVPGIGPPLAERLHRELGIETLEELELAAHDGRLGRLAGFGPRRVEAIQAALAARLKRPRPPAPVEPARQPPVAELLEVDREYREMAAAHRLPTVAPRRMNPLHRAWLPILHTHRGPRRYTALYSNTPRAHELDRTHEWVVLYWEEDGAGGQQTVVTSRSGPLRSRRVVRGREEETAEHYRAAGALVL
jgi:predicted flap endonuclease-1-like 5' DNA nuclease